MNRKELISKIVNSLDDEGALDPGNYNDTINQKEEAFIIIEKCLDKYEIVEGSILT